VRRLCGQQDQLAVLEARKELCRVRGYRAMPKLVKALEQHEVEQSLHDNAKAP
jgi:hypothetical protein